MRSQPCEDLRGKASVQVARGYSWYQFGPVEQIEYGLAVVGHDVSFVDLP
jgi:hypothetical protein